MFPMRIYMIALVCLLSGCDRGSKPVQTVEVAAQGIYSAAISNDGTLLVAGAMHHGASLWRMPESERLYDWRHNPETPLEMVAAAFSPDGSRAVTCDARTLVMWDTADGRALEFWGTPGTLRDVAVMPNGHEVLLGLEDQSAVLFDAADGAHRLTLLHEGAVNSVAIAHQSKLAITGADDNFARVWSLETGELMHRFPHSNPVISVAISSDGSLAFSAATNAESRVWDLNTGNIIYKISENDNGTTRAVFTQGDSFLLVGNVSGRVIRINMATGKTDQTWFVPASKTDRRAGTAILALGSFANGRLSAVSGNGQYILLN